MSELSGMLRVISNLQEVGRIEVIRRSYLFPAVFYGHFTGEERAKAIAAFEEFKAVVMSRNEGYTTIAAECLEGQGKLPAFIEDHPIEWERSLTYLAFGDGAIEHCIPKSVHEKALAKAVQIMSGTLNELIIKNPNLI